MGAGAAMIIVSLIGLIGCIMRSSGVLYFVSIQLYFDMQLQSQTKIFQVQGILVV